MKRNEKKIYKNISKKVEVEQILEGIKKILFIEEYSYKLYVKRKGKEKLVKKKNK